MSREPNNDNYPPHDPDRELEDAGGCLRVLLVAAAVPFYVAVAVMLCVGFWLTFHARP